MVVKIILQRYEKVDYIDIEESTFWKVSGYEKPVGFGVFTSFAYLLEGSLGEIVVATTQMETLLRDTVIAVHPDDSRYVHLYGKFIMLTFNGSKLPIAYDPMLRFVICYSKCIPFSLDYFLNTMLNIEFLLMMYP